MSPTFMKNYETASKSAKKPMRYFTSKFKTSSPPSKIVCRKKNAQEKKVKRSCSIASKRFVQGFKTKSAWSDKSGNGLRRPWSTYLSRLAQSLTLCATIFENLKFKRLNLKIYHNLIYWIIKCILSRRNYRALSKVLKCFLWSTTSK